jgi:hypothetical protein
VTYVTAISLFATQRTRGPPSAWSVPGLSVNVRVGFQGKRQCRRSPAIRRAVWADGKDAEPEQRSRIQPVPYRYRDLVERFISKLKHFRAVATRYDKSPESDLASVKLASVRIWMRVNESMT